MTSPEIPRSAHDLRWPDLVWSHFSRARFDDFDGRVRAAAAAGYAGMGLFVHAYQRMRDQGRSAADIAATVADHGLVLAEIELVRGWWATEGATNEGQIAKECRQLEQLAYELADATGARYLQVIGPYDCSVDQAAQGFANLCDRADEHGLKVGIEWLPFTNIATAADAQAIVESANRANGGYCVDIWHHTRGANDMSIIQALDPQRIFAIQMNDGSLTQQLPDYKADCLATRVPPGEGRFDCVGFIRELSRMGVTAPISVEVCSEALWAAPVLDAAQAGADGMRRVLAQARATA